MEKQEFIIDPYKVLKSLVEVTAPHLGEDFLRVVCDELKRLLDADLVFITRPIDYNPTTKVDILYSTNPDLPDSFVLEGSPCKLVYDNEVIQISQAVNQCFEGTKGTSFESFYGIPINDKDNNCIGHIAVFSTKIRTLPEEIEDIIKIFARRIEVEYERDILEKENKAITEQLEKLSVTDSLTELYNRRYFDKFAVETLNRVQRIHCKASLSFIDIDDFKKINDTYGHETGDKVLKYLADVLVNNARKGIDHIFRIGGEEFAVVSINTTSKKCIKYFNRINKELKSKPYDENIFITLSIGIDDFKSDDKTFDDTYKRADDKMYQAKNTGKDSIVT